MSDAIYEYKAKAQELKEFGRKNGFTVHIDTEGYPVKISIYAKQGGGQMSLFDNNAETADEEKTPGLQFIFYEKIELKTQDDFAASEEVFSKLKNLSKEVNRLYLNAFCQKLTEARKRDPLTLDDFPEIHPCDQQWREKRAYITVTYGEELMEKINRIIGERTTVTQGFFGEDE